jgi:hypothetical protein
MAEEWRIIGDFIDFCRCRLPCACSWGQPPDEGECDGLIAYRIREGHYGDVTLDGLNVAGLSHFEGNIWDPDTRMKAGFIIDERADDAQRQALQTIFGGQAGSWPKVFTDEVLGEMLGMEFARIDLEIANDASSWTLEIPGMAKGSTKVVTGPTTGPGEPVRVTNIPGSEAGPNSGPMTYGIAEVNETEGFGFKWDWSGRSSKHIPFEWSSEDEF